MRKLLIGLNNWITRLRKVRVAPGNLLLLAPHCLQRTPCKHNVIHDLDQCARCGQCNVGDLLRLRDTYGVQCSLASGGRQAIGLVRRADVHAVVAVACEKELVDGIRAAFPKPVLALPNLRPNGPCKDTGVDAAELEAVLRTMLVNLPGSSGTPASGSAATSSAADTPGPDRSGPTAPARPVRN